MIEGDEVEQRQRADKAPKAKGTAEVSAFSIPADSLVATPLVIDPVATAPAARTFTGAEIAASLAAAITAAWALRPPPRREAVDGHSWGRGRQDAVRVFEEAVREVLR